MIGSILVDKKPLVSVGPDATITQIAALLHEHRIGAVLVMDGDTIAGLVSERDICRCLHVHGAGVHDVCAQEIMTVPVVVTESRTSVAEAMAKLSELGRDGPSDAVFTFKWWRTNRATAQG